jgi:hypothetical protein
VTVPLIPEFVIVGSSHDDGVILVASTNLTRAELEEIRDERDDLFSDHLRAPIERRFRFEGEMRSFTMVQGPDYATALRTLMGHFDQPRSPFGRPVPAVGARLREIEGEPR